MGKWPPNRLLLPLTVALTAGALAYLSLRRQEPVDFSTQVKPILNKHCIACHGGVKKQGSFSLLFREEALGKTKSGKPAIVPGDPDHSEFITRLTHRDPEERMPYQEAPLPKEDIELLRTWVKQGATWGEHWAYSPPAAPEVPGKGLLAGFWPFGKTWEQTDLDFFVKNRLDDEGLKPSPPAEPATLLRRAALDLTGLPPTADQYRRFRDDPSPDHFSKLVDEFLASPAYGERWAALWLDLSRYADSKGYESDHRLNHQWHFRDYLINSFNADKPFDRFTREVLAGDLLPTPTDEQYHATIFHRNTLTNDEGGTDDEEFRTSAVLDRVNTTMEVWQGTTFGCVQCHSHPYDPFRHEDYYKFLAFFNNTADRDLRSDEPLLHRWRPAEQPKVAALKTWVRQHGAPAQAERMDFFLKFQEPKFYYRDFTPVRDASWAAVSNFMNLRPGTGTLMLPGISLDGKRELYVRYFTLQLGASLEVRDGSAAGPLLARVPFDTCGYFKPKLARVILPPGLGGRHDLYFVAQSAGKPYPGAKPGDANFVTDADLSVLWAMLHEGLPGRDQPGFVSQQKAFEDLLTAPFDGVPVMLEMPQDFRRKTQVFERGNWLVKGREVQPDVPRALGPMPRAASRNRLGLAEWLVSPQNPLTARTAVNRVWEQLFGIGLVETAEDFGTQGLPPSNRDLLDHLAAKFRDEFRWSQKKLLKYLVTSATYGQDSRASRELLEKDPYNRLLARGPRFRLTAEQVRDQTLAVSGLLSKKIGGPSVMPYQPDGVWQVPYDTDTWRLSDGDDRHRRAVYVYLKRSTPYPSLLTFDGSNRAACLSRRIRTNTPLQALVTLNDPVFAEAGRAYAKRMAGLGKTPEDRIEAGYRLAMGHGLTAKKRAALVKLYNEALAEFRAKPAELKKFLAGPRPDPQLAALTTVAGALLNLDEFVTKE